ncbi:GPP34 family phosphoprotein [Streptomyces sp. SCA3-4]|uniref:GOLPH3/VPS74 family protein n=1 Tax=Streptomyces sichuanensis TaxID=2871810 RepID=UPI001CE2398A|nr:GPP34 family phosphoprotein [Streptomyces sichuanensis]MCA6095687.1 GPP34 family phosphoprotein [Streptomyces sichuanensis]
MTDPGLTLPEELLLLAHAPADGKKLCAPRDLAYGLAGAVLAELELRGCVRAKDGRPVTADPVPQADPRLSVPLWRLGMQNERPPKTSYWIATEARDQEQSWVMGLLERRALRVHRQPVGRGLVPWLYYPVDAVDLTTPARAAFDAALRAGFPDPRARVLAALASATGIAKALYPGWGGRHDRKAMRRLRREHWIAAAVYHKVTVQSGTSSSGGDGGGGGCGGGHGCGSSCGGGCGGGGD